jgi:hypothetical protein
MNVQAYDDEDYEPMALDMDMDKMEKAMSNSHVDLIVSDFDHAPKHHHKHHKTENAEEQTQVQQKIQHRESSNDDGSDFDTKVLDAYTARNAGGNSDKAAIEEAVFENKRKATEAKEDAISH